MRSPAFSTLAANPLAGAPVSSSRLLLACLPRMLGEILERIAAADDDIVIAATVDRVEDLEATLHAARPDILLLGEQRIAPTLSRHHGLWVMVLSPSGRSAMLHREDRAPQYFDDLSPQEIVSVIKDAVPRLP
jgi:hypothetical protein